MTLMPEVRRLRLHAYLRVCSTELQLQPCTQFFNSSKYGFFRQVMELITVLIPNHPVREHVKKQNDQYLDLTGKDRV